MDGSSPDDDCYGEQEREGDDNPGVSEPRMVKAFMRTQSFAMPSTGNLGRSRRLSRSLIIRAQRSNRRVRARDLVTGAATVDFMSQAFGVLNQGTARLYGERAHVIGVPDAGPFTVAARQLALATAN